MASVQECEFTHINPVVQLSLHGIFPSEVRLQAVVGGLPLTNKLLLVVRTTEILGKFMSGAGEMYNVKFWQHESTKVGTNLLS